MILTLRVLTELPLSLFWDFASPMYVLAARCRGKVIAGRPVWGQYRHSRVVRARIQRDSSIWSWALPSSWDC